MGCPSCAGPRGGWVALGLSRVELGLPGTPWPSAHCRTCLSSSSVSATGEGADSPRQFLLDKWPQGMLESFGQLLPLLWEQVEGRRLD